MNTNNTNNKNIKIGSIKIPTRCFELFLLTQLDSHSEATVFVTNGLYSVQVELVGHHYDATLLIFQTHPQL